MKWSWDEFQAAPLYVRRFTLDLISIRRRVAAERDNRQRPGGAG